jgi:hypothetical protein
MRDANKAPRQDPDKVLIDRMIDWRCLNQPQNKAPIKTNLDPKSLSQALGFTAFLTDDGEYPDSLIYRGFQVLTKLKR